MVNSDVDRNAEDPGLRGAGLLKEKGHSGKNIKMGGDVPKGHSYRQHRKTSGGETGIARGQRFNPAEGTILEAGSSGLSKKPSR